MGRSAIIIELTARGAQESEKTAKNKIKKLLTEQKSCDKI